MGQLWQPFPQEDFPCLLFFIRFMIIAATIASKTIQIKMVAMFSKSHANMKISSFVKQSRFYFTQTSFVSLSDSL